MPLLIIAGILVLWGTFAIYSVSIFESFQITQKLGDPSNYFYFIRHLRNLIIALFVASLVYLIPLKFIKNHKGKIFIFFLILQLLIFTPLGIELQGARGWLNLGLYTLQPSEFFKIAFVLFLSGWFLKKKKILRSIYGYIAFLIIISLFFLIFLKIPDLGTVLVLGPVSLMLYWYAGGRIRYIIFTLLLGLFFGAIIGTHIGYIKKRIDYFLNPEIDTSGRGIGWQTTQALIAVGAGGFFGQGYGKGLQKLGYIPEAQSDFIFAAFSEEIGFFGNLIFLSILFFLIYIVLSRIKYIEDDFFKLFAFGLISLIFWQTFVNIGVNIKLIPLTGLTLPFVSYGGTSLMSDLIIIVLLYKILYNKN